MGAVLNRIVRTPHASPAPAPSPRPRPEWAPPPFPWPRWLATATLALVVLGLGWRLLRYASAFPVWGDEAFVCLNFLDRGYVGLTQPLRFSQVAPVLFLWAELTAFRCLGGSELALRLVPFLCGLAAVPAFARLARQSVPPLAAGLAVGLLAVAYYPVRHCCEVKPYGSDLLLAVVVLLPAAAWVRQPEQSRWPLTLALLLPLVLGASYPAVFVAAGVSVTLLPAVVRRPTRGLVLAFGLYNAALAAGFLGWYALAGLGQFQSTHGVANVQWDSWFPPAAPGALLRWLAAAHTGNMFAYPMGGRDGGSAATALLCLLGAWRLYRSGQRRLLGLLTAPFGLTLAAAALHRYPYGGSARVAQHLAPCICLLAGVGLAALIHLVARTGPGRRRLALAALAGLGLIGVGGVARDLVKPYKTAGDHEARRLAEAIAAEAGPRDQIIVLEEDWRLPPGLEWYLRVRGPHIFWQGNYDAADLAAATGNVWVFATTPFPERLPAVTRALAEGPRPFAAVGQQDYHFQFGWDANLAMRCRVTHWQPAAPPSPSP